MANGVHKSHCGHSWYLCTPFAVHTSYPVIAQPIIKYAVCKSHCGHSWYLCTPIAARAYLLPSYSSPYNQVIGNAPKRCNSIIKSLGMH